jgi:hypothetical protein
MIWLGSAIPSQIHRNAEEWRNIYPESFVLWTDHNLGDFDSSIVLDSDLHPVIRADLLRVLIIQKHGGWYVDADTSPGNLELKAYVNPIFCLENERRALNGLFYSPQGHPFLNLWRKEIESSIEKPLRRHSSIADLTGPGALNRALQEYLAIQGKVESGISVLPHGLKVEGSLMSKGQQRRSLGVHQALKSWNTIEGDTPNPINFSQSLYLKWIYWGHLGFVRETLRVLLNAPKIYLKNIHKLSFHVYLMSSHPLEPSSYGNLFTTESSKEEDFIELTKNATVARIKSSHEFSHVNYDSSWYRISFFKHSYFYRRNHIRNLEIAYDY